jgi:uncharacterized membrane protein
MSDEHTDRVESESGHGDEQAASESRQISEIANEVENVTKEQKRLKERLVESRSLTISPTLPPDYLEAYERLCPGAGRRILLSSNELAEREQETDLELSRRDQDLKENESKQSSRRSDRAQMYAFILSMTAVVGGLVLLALGMDVAGLGAIITPVAGLVAVFITNRVFPRGLGSAKRDDSAELVRQMLEQVRDDNSPSSEP